MFGYVRPFRAKLTETEQKRYDAVYCGLCHAMGKRYGFLSRFTLTYDFTFLAMLLAADGADAVTVTRYCPAHPLRKKGCTVCSALDTAADEGLILTWHKLRDDVRDKGLLSGIPARCATWGLYRAYRRAKRRCPAFDREVRLCLDELRRLEEQQCPSLDRTADTFARLLQAARPSSGNETQDRALGQLLYHLGRWIYLVDAWDDLEDDRKKNCYNPLDVRFQNAPESHLEELRTTMTHSLRLCASAFQLAELGEFRTVVENILYLGLPTVQEAVLERSWHEMQRNRRNQHE